MYMYMCGCVLDICVYIYPTIPDDFIPPPPKQKKHNSINNAPVETQVLLKAEPRHFPDEEYVLLWRIYPHGKRRKGIVVGLV